MAFLNVEQLHSFLLLSILFVSSSHAFMDNFTGKKQPVNVEIRPDLMDVVDRQDNTQLNIQLHVGDRESGFLTVQDMIIQLGGQYDEEKEGRVMLPGVNGAYSKCTSGGRRMNIVSKGKYVNMKGTQHIDCDKECWEMCWVRGSPAGTIIFAFNLPQTYSRNEAILPEGPMWLSFPVWTEDGLKYGQMAKQELLDEIEMYTRKWNEELDKYELTDNPIMKAIHERNAHIYATKCDDLWDYSLDTIPEDEHCSKLQEDLLLSNRGLIWKKHGNEDVLLGNAVVSLCEGTSLSSFSSGRLRP
jgi:hypothetical protein